MSEFKNTSSETKIVMGSIVHPGSTIEVDDVKDPEVEGIAGMERTRPAPKTGTRVPVSASDRKTGRDLDDTAGFNDDDLGGGA
jgi:hypothetical protein